MMAMTVYSAVLRIAEPVMGERTEADILKALFSTPSPGARIQPHTTPMTASGMTCGR